MRKKRREAGLDGVCVALPDLIVLVIFEVVFKILIVEIVGVRKLDTQNSF